MTPYEMLEKVKLDYKENKPQEFIGFWNGGLSDTEEEGTFSNFQRALFTVDVGGYFKLRAVKNVKFTSSEQYFMFLKAYHFNDHEMMEKMVEKGHEPYHYKMLGRQVKNYKDDEWDKVRYGYMLDALRAKYRQNKDLQKIILDTGDAILVEASPFDKIWGVGLAKSTKNGKELHDWKNPLKWRGDNLLGFALMDIREELLEDNDINYGKYN